jgi:hypothetical protein
VDNPVNATKLILTVPDDLILTARSFQSSNRQRIDISLLATNRGISRTSPHQTLDILASTRHQPHRSPIALPGQRNWRLFVNSNLRTNCLSSSSVPKKLVKHSWLSRLTLRLRPNVRRLDMKPELIQNLKFQMCESPSAMPVGFD